MNIPSPIDDFYEKTVRDFTRDSNVIGIMLFWSAANGENDDRSDIDLYVLLEKEWSLSRKNFKNGDTQVDVLYDTVSDIDAFLEEERNGIRRVASHMFAHGRALFEKDSCVTLLIDKAKGVLSGKTKHAEDDIIMHKYSIDDFLSNAKRNLEKEQPLGFYLNSHLLIRNVMEAFMERNGNYWLPEKKMDVAFMEMEPELYETIVRFAHATTDAAKLEILSEIAERAYSTLGWPLPDGWEILRRTP